MTPEEEEDKDTGHFMGLISSKDSKFKWHSEVLNFS
jgi:hypothetical protein